MNKIKSTIMICGMMVLFSNVMVFTSISGIVIDTASGKCISLSSSSIADWDVIAEDIPVEWDDTAVDDNLRESIYSLVVGDWVWDGTPFGSEVILFDEIEVRRIVRNDIDMYHDAILILPQQYTDANGVIHLRDYYDGEQMGNPANTYIYPYVEAGFDVYVFSSRDHNCPPEFIYNYVGLYDMFQWGAREYLDDINEAVELVKNVSGFNRIYLNGQEIGTALAMMYATEHQENLKGLLCLTGGTGGLIDKEPFIPTAVPDITDLNACYDYINTPVAEGGAGGAWLATSSGILDWVHEYSEQARLYPESEDIVYMFGETPLPWFDMYYYFSGFSDVVPIEIWWSILSSNFGIPFDDVFTGDYAFDTKEEAIFYFTRNVLGVSTYAEDYSMTVEEWLVSTNLVHAFYPWRVVLDIRHMIVVEYSEYLEYDWDQHFDEINVPIISYVDTLTANWWDQADYSSDIPNPDNTVYIIENWGYGEIFSQKAQDLVILPSIEWILSRRILDGVIGYEIDGIWYECMEVTVFINPTHIRFLDGEYIEFEITLQIDWKGRSVYEAEAMEPEELGTIYGNINKKGKASFGGQHFWCCAREA